MSCTYIHIRRRNRAKGFGAAYAITTKLLNPMVIWRITPRSNGSNAESVCMGVLDGSESSRRVWRGMFRAHATANINIPLWRAIRPPRHPRVHIGGAHRRTRYVWCRTHSELYYHFLRSPDTPASQP